MLHIQVMIEALSHTKIQHHLHYVLRLQMSHIVV